MAYVDLARSHVKECLREAFALPQLVVDEDGDVPFTHGTAVYYVTVRGDGRRVKAWAHAVRGVKRSAALLRELNEVNRSRELARVHVVHDRVVVEGVLAVDGLSPEDLRELCLEVGTIADEVGTMISTVHGGVVASPDGSCDHCGS